MRSRIHTNLPVILLTVAVLLASTDGAAFGQQSSDMGRSLSAALGAQGRLMWVDGTANLTRTFKIGGQTKTIDYTTTREGVIDVVRRCKAAHINTLVIDVKPLSGQVLYNSKVAPRMKTWKGRAVPDFDVLAAFVEEGHKAGLQVDACINVLSEGHKYFSIGPAYEHPDWQSVVYTVDRGLLAGGARLSVRIPGEPSDPAAPTLLQGGSAILGSEPTSGLVGLEGVESKGGVVTGEEAAPPGKQLNLILDEANQVMGMVDSALLGDDPLMAPEGGRLIPATREADIAWFARYLKPGDFVGFDMHTGRTPIAQAPSEKIACFINPLHPEARRHELDLIREIVSGYDIDGLVLDRCRFSNLYNDFSDRTRDAFAQWLRVRTRKTIGRWPQDIFEFPASPQGKSKNGPLYREWLEFRAQVIRDFVAEVARTARGLKPRLVLGTYVGSWYPAYYEVGVNWGSPNTHLRYAWFTPDYPRTGYAEFFDWISTGCYYPTATQEDAWREGMSGKATVEFAAQLSNLAVANGAFVYAGIYAQDYARKPEVFLRALQAAGRQSQGWMIFDLSYINDYDWWPLLERAYPKEAPSPDRLANLLPELRAAANAAKTGP